MGAGIESNNKAYQSLMAMAADGRIRKNPFGDEVEFFAKESAIENLKWRKIPYTPHINHRQRRDYSDWYDMKDFHYSFTLDDLKKGIERSDPGNSENASLVDSVIETTKPLERKQVKKAYGRS